MLYGLFYMIDSALGRNDPVKRHAEILRLKMAGQKDRRKTEHELMKLRRPTYQVPDELKPQ